ncbi:hypothetical protein IJI91_00875 [Candidatus Saccharibacteria bacterium]|nr:hypothetical protein [Candidatus Saccharibacteria bacterium]
MLIDVSRVINCPVLSLHLGAPIARTVSPVIDPEQLQIIAFTLDGPDIGNGEIGDILDTRSIREFSDLGIIIDSADELVSRTDVIKIDKAMSLNFHLIDLKVESKRGAHLGKVISFIIDSETFTTQQIIVKRPTLKSFMDPELTIHRSEIIEVNDFKIIVKDDEKTLIKKSTTENFTPNFVNPFRTDSHEPQFAPTDNQTPDAPNN